LSTIKKMIKRINLDNYIKEIRIISYSLYNIVSCILKKKLKKISIEISMHCLIFEAISVIYFDQSSAFLSVTDIHKLIVNAGQF